MNFKEFVVYRYLGKVSDRGIFASVINVDDAFPRSNDREEIIAYLNSKSFPSTSVDTFLECFDTFERWLKKNNLSKN